MITIYSPCWHDDGIVECCAILQNVVASTHSLRASRGKLMDVREALYDAARAFKLPDLDEEGYESHSAVFDALAFVTEALQKRTNPMRSLRLAIQSLNRLHPANCRYQA